MLFRFTLSNDIEGSLVISEPGGWDSAKFKLERNKDYHSLVEFYDQPLMFYGEDISDNGGIQYIRNIEETQGIDAQISLLIELNETGTWETAFEGLLSIETAKEIDFYKLEMGVIRNDFWQKFINRKGTPVDLSASVDLDGNARTPVSPITLNLPSQKIRQKYDGRLNYNYGFNDCDSTLTGGYIQLDMDQNLISEIEQKFTLPIDQNTEIPVSIFDVEFDGNYEFDLRIEMSKIYYTTDSGAPTCNQTKHIRETDGNVDWYIQINNQTPITFTADNVFVIPFINAFGTTYTYADSVSLIKGDQIRIYGKITTSVTDGHTRSLVIYGFGGISDLIVGEPIMISAIDCSIGGCQTEPYNNAPYSGVEYPTYFKIHADTVFQDTETEAFVIKDAAESILSKLIGQNNIVTSDYLDSCAGLYAIMKGLHVRGYSLADKQFSLSFDDWWKGVEPILNLGLSYENTSPETIRIEPKSYFYDKTTSINFDWVNNIERSYDLDSVFKLIEIGYNKWSAESDSGIDDPQTKRWYSTRFKTVGKEIKILSQFIAASLAIEQTRRNRVEEGKDWRLDDDVMIIALKDTSPYEPELAENFSDVTGLLNYETRYNIRLSVARNFERWKDYFNGCLQWYLTDDYKFSNGEGNYDMTSTLFADDCEAVGVSPEATLSEKQDIEVTSDYLFKPIKYSFVHPMTWEEYQTIRDNPTKAIGISRSDSNHVACFIDLLEYEITHGRATFEVYLADDPI